MGGRYRLAAVSVLAAAFMFGAADARAETLKLTLGASHSPNLPFVGLMGKFVKPEIDKRIAAAGLDVKIEWTEAYSGALYTFQGTLEGVEEGLGDVGDLL